MFKQEVNCLTEYDVGGSKISEDVSLQSPFYQSNRHGSRFPIIWSHIFVI